jgi:hypothetical protein
MVHLKLGALVLSLAAAAHTVQDSTVYRHPSVPVSIEAPTGWKAASWPGDPGVFEVAAPDGSITALLWFTATEQSADRYLNKMVNMKPLEPVTPVETVDIGGLEAWRIVARGSEQGHSGILETFVVVNSHLENEPEGNFILQVWCAESRREELSPLIEDIVGSLKVYVSTG